MSCPRRTDAVRADCPVQESIKHLTDAVAGLSLQVGTVLDTLEAAKVGDTLGDTLECKAAKVGECKGAGFSDTHTKALEAAAKDKEAGMEFAGSTKYAKVTFYDAAKVVSLRGRIYEGDIPTMNLSSRKQFIQYCKRHGLL